MESVGNSDHSAAPFFPWDSNTPEALFQILI